jgi:hypothetical protein
MNYKCPCCGYYTLPERANGTYDICPVCFWEDDGVQLKDHEYVGGANRVSLNQAKENYLNFGVCELEMKIHVRPPNEKEKQGRE